MGSELPRNRWFRAVAHVVGRLEQGSMTLHTTNGHVFTATGTRPGPHAVIIARDERLWRRIILGGEMGFAEAWLDGWWDTPDLQAVLDVALLNNGPVARALPGGMVLRLIERCRHWLNRNSRSGSRRNIHAHYDLGNQFYGLWLDETMTYSSARFTPDAADLPAAQRRKYHGIIDKLKLAPDSHVLEVGCGWGGFAEVAARDHGLRVTGLTISKEQHDFAKKRMFEAGLAERVDIVMRDYRDEQGRYDGVASIEMFEAVGEKYWPVYFDSLRDRLQPGGTAALQVITIADDLFASYRRGVDFVQKHVFPGGMLPSPSVQVGTAAKSGLIRTGSEEFGQDYSRTLRHWRERFNAVWPEVEKLGFDDRFHRLWNFYLASCASCFMAGTTDVTQVALRRI